ncbi:hypothetical protein SABIM44S_02194 [Streptomyces abikoensis]
MSSAGRDKGPGALAGNRGPASPYTPVATRSPELPGSAPRTFFPEQSAPRSINPLGAAGQPFPEVTRTRGVTRFEPAFECKFYIVELLGEE